MDFLTTLCQVDVCFVWAHMCVCVLCECLYVLYVCDILIKDITSVFIDLRVWWDPQRDEALEDEWHFTEERREEVEEDQGGWKGGGEEEGRRERQEEGERRTRGKEENRRRRRGRGAADGDLHVTLI